MHFIRKFNKEICSLGVIDVYGKCAWGVPSKDKKSITITNAFQKILNESNRKQTKYGQIKARNFTNDQ